jgi:hypothetical protein
MMRAARLQRYLPVLLVLALIAFPAGPAAAQNPAGPAAPQAVLYDQTDFQSGAHEIGSNYESDNTLVTKAADDFPVSSALSSWQITAVEVVGIFSGGSGSPSVNFVNVSFYADGGGKPAYPVYSASVHPVSGTATSGNFFLPLSPSAYLAAGRTYWVSVQAVQAIPPWRWFWRERSVKNQSGAVWENPGGGFGAGCTSWTPIQTCLHGSDPDLLFRLFGSESTKVVPKPLFLPIVRR